MPINPENEFTNAEISNSDEVHIVYDGSWENKGRSIAAAAFTGLIGIGAIYSYVQSFFYILLISLTTAMGGNKNVSNYKIPILIGLSVSQFLLLLAPALWITKKWHTKDFKKYLRIKKCRTFEIVLAVLITVSLMPVTSFISYLIIKLINFPVSYTKAGPDLFTANSGLELIIVFLAVAVTPAICEEIFFRGYFQRTLERTMGMKSFVITGVIFGLFHMQPLGLVSLSILGMLLSFLFYRSKSIFPSSAAHFTNNTMAVLLYYYDSKVPAKSFINPGQFPFWVIIISLAAAGLLLWLYIHLTRNKNSADENIKYSGMQE